MFRTISVDDKNPAKSNKISVSANFPSVVLGEVMELSQVERCNGKKTHPALNGFLTRWMVLIFGETPWHDGTSVLRYLYVPI